MHLDKQRIIASDDRALTFREAKKLYGIPGHRLRLCRSQRTLDFFKIGRAVFVSEKSLLRLMEACREPAILVGTRQPMCAVGAHHEDSK